MSLILRKRAAGGPSIDGDVLNPEGLAHHTPAELGRLPLRAGNGTAELGELFAVEGDLGDGHLVLEGDLRNVSRIGLGMASGRLTVCGDAGTELGAEMSGGTIEAEGNVDDWAGTEMRGGTLRIRGNAGRYLGGAFPGSRKGMRDGVILVDGSVGEDSGLAMRRGLIAIGGRSGDGLGRGLIAGSIFAFGPVGRRLGAGMKRGTLALFGAGGSGELALLPTFSSSGRARPPFLDLYLRRLRQWGFPVPEGTFAGPLSRYNGDLVERGQGEVLVWG